MFLAAADHYDAAHQALAVLLGLNGLRVSEACETNVEDLAVERGRILRITGKGNKPATIPLVPRTARTIDPIVGERHWVGHALHEPVHANDLWIAASAVHISAPILTADAVFDGVPELTLHR